MDGEDPAGEPATAQVSEQRGADAGPRDGAPQTATERGASSRRMRQDFPDLLPHYYRANRLWSGSYFAGSLAGAPLTVLRHYIEQQNQPA
jgi:REP element-mobilizing transposase RayT